MHSDSGLGNMVVLTHGHGMRTIYGHMSKVKVKTGQILKRGDLIGLVGSTGLSTGPHLHYEVEVKGGAVDPLKFIIE
jgi:murein DD-endopeptidase MepM/ murein hydrolase activator NlpD